MPEPTFDLKRVKLKTSPELSPAEKEFLISKKDDLNDEDKAAYADWLPEEISGIKFNGEENPTLKTAVSDEGGENEEGEKKAEEDKEEETNEDDTASEDKEKDEKTPQPQYATREDVVSAIDHAFEKLTPFLSKTEVKEKKEDMKKALFEEGKKYTLDEAASLIKEETKRETIEEIRKEQAQRTDAANKDMQNWVNQYQELAKEHSLPALNTKEGQEMWKKLDEIGGKENFNSFKQAYRLYTLLPEDQGGIVKAKQSEQDTKKEEEKKKLSAQKQAAGKVSGGRGSEDKGKAIKKYSDIHVPLDQYIQSH